MSTDSTKWPRQGRRKCCLAANIAAQDAGRIAPTGAVMRLFVAIALIAFLAAPAVAQESGIVSRPGNWLPQSVSTFGDTIDKLFYFILYMTGLITLGVFITMGAFLARYRHQPGRHATFIHGNNRLETVWTLIPTVILALTAVFSQTTWSQVKSPFIPPTPQEVISREKIAMEVVAKQFEWYFHYPGKDGILGGRKLELINTSGGPAEQIGLDATGAGADDFVTQQLVVPVDKPVYINLTSRDVIHSFFLPNFRLKQDAVPGLVAKVWFQAKKTSEDVVGTDPSLPLTVYVESTGEVQTITNSRPFDIACAELCGQGHFKMRGMLYVVTPQEYERYISFNEQNVAGATDADDGGY